jgi:hypothetical protein
MVNLSPTEESYFESLCTLRFAKQVNQCELGKPKRQLKDAPASLQANAAASSSQFVEDEEPEQESAVDEPQQTGPAQPKTPSRAHATATPSASAAALQTTEKSASAKMVASASVTSLLPGSSSSSSSSSSSLLKATASSASSGVRRPATASASSASTAAKKMARK